MDKVPVTITEFARWKGLNRSAFEKACLEGADHFNGWPLSDWLVRDKNGRPDHLLVPKEAVERHLEGGNRECVVSPPSDANASATEEDNEEAVLSDGTDQRKTGKPPVDRENEEGSRIPEKEETGLQQARSRPKTAGRKIIELGLVTTGAFGLAVGIYSLMDRPDKKGRATQDLGQRGFARDRG